MVFPLAPWSRSLLARLGLGTVTVQANLDSEVRRRAQHPGQPAGKGGVSVHAKDTEEWLDEPSPLQRAVSRRTTSAACIQQRWRERQRRERTAADAGVATFVRSRAARVIQRHVALAGEKARMMGECHAILEKQGRGFGLTLHRWEVVVWQERLVSLTRDALVYQHICRSKGQPHGREKRIPYAGKRRATVCSLAPA